MRALRGGRSGGRALCFYAAKLLVPVRQSFMYARWDVDPAAAWQWLFPALGFFNVYPFKYSFVADHFQYLAVVPFLVLVLASARAALARLAPSRTRASAALATVLVLTLAGPTQRRVEAFTSALALWRDVVAKDPRSKIGNEHLGNALRDAGDFPAALAQLTHAIALHPDYADNHNDRGVLLMRMQRNLAALSDFNRAIELDPDLAVAYFNRGNLLLAMGNVGQGTADLMKVRELARGGDANSPAPQGK